MADQTSNDEPPEVMDSLWDVFEQYCAAAMPGATPRQIAGFRNTFFAGCTTVFAQFMFLTNRNTTEEAWDFWMESVLKDLQRNGQMLQEQVKKQQGAEHGKGDGRAPERPSEEGGVPDATGAATKAG